MATPINPFASPTAGADPASFVQADCFRGLTLSGFTDRFQVFGPSPEQLGPRIVHFYRQIRARVVADQFPLQFTRGGLLGSLLGPETWAKQVITIERIEAEQLELRIEYRVHMVLPIRPPWPETLREVHRLAIELEAINPK
jgi:hypothetical protein